METIREELVQLEKDKIENIEARIDEYKNLAEEHLTALVCQQE